MVPLINVSKSLGLLFHLLYLYEKVGECLQSRYVPNFSSAGRRDPASLKLVGKDLGASADHRVGRCAWLCLGQRKLGPQYVPQRPLCSLSASLAPGEATGEPLATSLCPQYNLFSLSGLHPRALATLLPALWLTLILNHVSQGSALGSSSVQHSNRPSFPLPPPSQPLCHPEPQANWPCLAPNPSLGPYQGHGGQVRAMGPCGSKMGGLPGPSCTATFERTLTPLRPRGSQ